MSRKVCLACDREFTGKIGACPHDGTVLVPLKEDSFIGTVIADRYRVLSVIGQGGMGLVYLANHEMMDRKVAIKMLHTELASDPVSVKRFQQEAKAASSLNHPHLITLHDFGITPSGQPFLVMEYLEGVPLLDVIKRTGPLDPKRAVKIFSEVADGLHHAHNQGIVHRDLKPSNILLINSEGDPDFVKVVDFGLAKLMPWSGKESQHLTKTGEVFGSPIYMSPEQCMGKPFDPRSDIYSMGITLFEALTGKPPFRGQNSIQTATKHMQDAPPRFADVRPDLNIPAALEKICFKALEKNPADRFSTMAEMKEAMEYAVSDNAEIPQSLLVSQRGQSLSPARTAQAAPEAPKRPAPDLRSMESKPRFRPLNIGIAAGALIAAGIGGYFGWQAAHQEAPLVNEQSEGVVYYLQNDSSGHSLHLKTKSGLLKLSFESIPRSTQLALTDMPNGAVVNAAYHTKNGKSLIDSLAVSDRIDDPVRQADRIVRNYFSALAVGELDSAEKMSTPSYRTALPAAKLQSVYPVSRFRDLSKPENEEGANPGVRGAGPPANATKIESVDKSHAVVLADSKFFFKKPCGYLCLSLQKNSPQATAAGDPTWLIDKIDENVGPFAWNEF